ncbi:lamin tail domain-containing protein [Nocardioides sp. LHG3406-4]|uniref:lamin tail domain-containing protein n=1 Tax=Nocardioides sp. LHG3406-4 TaxID=2804575 RepID=UPI003CF18502
MLPRFIGGLALAGLAAPLTALPVHAAIPVAAAAAPSSSVVINELHTNTRTGANDSFVELRNIANAPVDVSGWLLQGCNATGNTGANRAVLPAATILDPGEHFLLANSGYALATVPDEPFAPGLTPDGGVVLKDASAVTVDAVGYVSLDCVEGAPAPRPTDGALSVSRDAAGTDTDDNAADFTVGTPSPTASEQETDPSDPPPAPEQDPVPARVRAGDRAVERVIEAESLLPAVETTALLASPANCCGLVRYGNQALTFGGGSDGGTGDVGDSFTLAFEVPRDGRYELSGAYMLEPTFAAFGVAVDGVPLGAEVDLYSPTVKIDPRIVHGAVDLTAGRHEVTFTITGANPASSLRQGHRISVDLLRLRELPTESRLNFTPEDGKVVKGVVPIYGWSSDAGDSLDIELDGQPVTSRATLADTATLVYEARGVQSVTGHFANHLVLRGQTVPIGSDVGAAGTDFETDFVDLPADLLSPGTNSITIAAGPTAAEGELDKDDFTVRNVRLELADGTVLTPDQGSGSFEISDEDEDSRPSMGFSFDVPAEAGRVSRGLAWDTSAVANGEHSVTLQADGPQGPESQTATVLVDNLAPTFATTSPAEAQQVKGTFTIDASVDDGVGGRIESLTATLDGTAIDLPQTLHTDDLTDGTHTVEFTATDAAENVTIESVTFTTVAQTPEPAELISPADGATGVESSPTLRVSATDPAGDPLAVTFLEASSSQPEVGASFQGASPAELDAPVGPEETGVDVAAASSSDDVYAETGPSEEFPFQRYDLTLSQLDADRVDVTWEGRVQQDREVVVSVLDMSTQEWVPVATGRGQAGHDTTLVADVDLDMALDGDVVHVLVQGRDPFADIEDDAPDEKFEDPKDYDFAIAWLTDTQYLSEGAVEGKPGFGEAFTGINQWIADNADERKIVYAAHTGDLINNWVGVNEKTPEQVALARQEFQFASDAMDILEDAGIPYGVTPGNHDGMAGTSNDLYNEYFPPSRYEAASQTATQDYYGGSWKPADNQNHFDLFEAGGQKFIAVYLGFVAGQEEIDWADQVLEEHSDRKAIFLTHEYLQPSKDAQGRGGALSAETERSQGQELFDEVVLPNDNVFLTLSGHTHGVALNIKRDVGAPGRTVVEMLANYQFYEIGGQRRTGYFRMLQFDVDRSEVAVDTYSPALHDYNADEYDTSNNRAYVPAADEFRVPVDLASRTTSVKTDAVAIAVRTDTVIGTAANAGDGLAEVTWAGLAPGTSHSWYARSDDQAGGVSESAVFTFRTKSADPTGPSDPGSSDPGSSDPGSSDPGTGDPGPGVPSPTAPSIVTQPGNRAILVGGSTTFVAEAHGESLSYQWQQRRKGAAGWSNVPGATTSRLTVTPRYRSWSGARFRVVVTNPAGSVTSEEATLNVLKGRARVRLLIPDRQVRAGERTQTVVRVKAAGLSVYGEVKFRVDGRVVGLARLRNGYVRFHLPPLSRGVHRIRASYLGSANLSAARSAEVRVTIGR